MRRFLLLSVLVTLTATSPVSKCFERQSSRNIENYFPIREYYQISLQQCMKHCIDTKTCVSVTFERDERVCRLYDTDGMKVPAIVLPVFGVDIYARNGVECSEEGASPVLPQQTLQYEKSQPKDVEQGNTISENKPVISTPADIKPYAPSPNVHGKCDTTYGYFVVIGNEVLLPQGQPGSMHAYEGISQSACAEICSQNKATDGSRVECNSINFFPLKQRCEVYDVLAEPHGPGNLVDNEEAIYSEKFCLPEHDGVCRNDEVFILHVQKKVTQGLIKEVNAVSISSCLQQCLNTLDCATAVFMSETRKCALHSLRVGAQPEKVVDTDAGTVMIENGCAESGARRKVVEAEREETPTAGDWTEWSDCSFIIDGDEVRTRTRDCDDCEALQFEKC